MAKLKDQLIIQEAGTNAENDQVLISDTPQVTFVDDGPAPAGQPTLKPHQRIDVHVSRGPGGCHKSIEPAAKISLIGGSPKIKRDTNHDLVLWFDRVLSIGGEKGFKQLGINLDNNEAIKLAVELLEGLCSVYALKFFAVAPTQDEEGNAYTEDQRKAIATKRVGIYKGMLEFMRKEIDKAEDAHALDMAADYIPEP